LATTHEKAEMMPIIEDMLKGAHLMNKAQAIDRLADILMEVVKTYPAIGYVYGIRWKDNSTYVYVGRTKWPNYRIDDHKVSSWPKEDNGNLVRKKPSKDDDIEMAVLLRLEEHPYLVYEYEHRFTLEYLRCGHSLQICEFRTDQTDQRYNYISATLDDIHIKGLMSDKYQGWYYPYFSCHLTYYELYTAIREKTGTVDYQPAISAPWVWQ
jgi:GIY-YIG catalytic domain